MAEIDSGVPQGFTYFSLAPLAIGFTMLMMWVRH